MNDNQALQVTQNDKMLSMSSLNDMKAWYNDFVSFSKEILKQDLDYGVIPGVNKPSLYKPGAEKLRFVYGLGVEINLSDKTEDFDRNFLDYTYKATVKGRNGEVIAECEGNANSYESKWRYNWVVSDKNPTKEEADQLKAEKKGRWTKQGNNWVWLEKQENPDVTGLKNTLIKMSQKRAFVGAILIATGASEFFTQDVEDIETFAVGDVAQPEMVVTNKYAPTIEALKKAGQIEDKTYLDLISDETRSGTYLKNLKAERDAK